MLKALVKKELSSLFQNYYMDRKKGTRRSKASTIIWIIFGIGLFVGLGFVFFGLASSLSALLVSQGLDYIYFALGGIIAIALGVFGSVFNTYSALYLSRDNELMLSLPIPGTTLLLSKLVSVYAMSLLYSGWVWLPVICGYWVSAGLQPLQVLLSVLMLFVIALFVLTLTCVLGFFVAVISTKTRGKSFITVILSLTVMIVYYVVYFKVMRSLNEIIDHIGEIEQMMRTKLGFFYMIGKAGAGKPVSFLLFTVITLALTALCIYLMSRSFLSIASAQQTGVKKKARTERFAASGIRGTLLRRELRHFASSPTWMLNCGLGIAILPIAAIAAVIKAGTIREIITATELGTFDLGAAMPVLLLVVIGMIVTMNAITGPSISLEGKTLWILQTLPVDMREVLRMKAAMHWILNMIPGVFAAVVIGIVVKLNALEILLVILTLSVYIAAFAVFGLMLNVQKPNLNWTNEVVPVKQSIVVLILLFGGWGMTMALAGIGYFLSFVMPGILILLIFFVIFAALTLVIYRYLMTKGAEKLSTL